MQKKFRYFILVALFLGGFIWNSHAEETTVVGSQKVEKPADDHDDNDGHATEKISQEFKVSEQQINDLREKKLGYGEINHVYSMASQMPGGITDENVNKILDMRQNQKMGWGNIKKELELKKLSDPKNENSSSKTEPTTDAKPEKKVQKEKTHLEKFETKEAKAQQPMDRLHHSDRTSMPGKVR